MPILIESSSSIDARSRQSHRGSLHEVPATSHIAPCADMGREEQWVEIVM